MSTPSFRDILRAAEHKLEGKISTSAPKLEVELPPEKTPFYGEPAFLFQIQTLPRVGLKTAGSSYIPMKRSARIRPALSVNLSEETCGLYKNIFELCEEFDLPYIHENTTTSDLRLFFRRAALKIHPDHHFGEGDAQIQIYANKFRLLKAAIDTLIFESQSEIRRQAA